MSVERQRDLVSSFDTRRRSALTTTTVKPLWMMVVTMSIIDPKGVVRKVYLKVSPNPHSAEVLADLAELQK